MNERVTARLQQWAGADAALWAVALAGILAGDRRREAVGPPASRSADRARAWRWSSWSAPRCSAAGWGRGARALRTGSGPAMVLIGFAWFAEELTNATTPWLNTLGIAVQSYWIAGHAVPAAVVPVGTPDTARASAAGRGAGCGQAATGGDADREPGGAVVQRMRAQRRPGGPRQPPGARPAQARAPGRPDPGGLHDPSADPALAARRRRTAQGDRAGRGGGLPDARGARVDRCVRPARRPPWGAAVDGLPVAVRERPDRGAVRVPAAAAGPWEGRRAGGRARRTGYVDGAWEGARSGARRSVARARVLVPGGAPLRRRRRWLRQASRARRLAHR